jgi:acetyl/propionyl-CoA carboxylase alpha subunit
MLYKFQVRGQVFEIILDRQGAGYRVTVEGQPNDVEVLAAEPGQISLRFDGRPLTLYWAADGADQWVSLNGCTYRLERPSPRGARASAEAGGGQAVRAPMPAQVRAVQVAQGEAVTLGQTLLLLEAMKMEIRIKTPAAGHVTRLLVSPGQTVEKDQLLAEIGE